jgi:hypothetical protein
MNNARGTPFIKAKIVRLILDNQIRAHGTPASSLASIQLLKSDCREFAYFWEPFSDATLNRHELARLLQCDHDTVSQLVKQGIVKGCLDGHSLRIDRASADSFRENYSFLAPLGRELGLHQAIALPLCKRAGIEVYYVGSRRRAFINNASREKLIRLLKRERLAKK